MSRSLLKVFERCFSKNPYHNNNLWTVLIFGGMVFLLLFTLTSFALASSGDQFDEDEFPFLEIAGFHAISGFSYLSLLTIGFELGVLFTILRLEFLKSHIGEKRPSPAARWPQLVEIAYLLQTAPTRLCSAVFLFLLSKVPGRNSIPVFARGRTTLLSFQEMFLIY